MISELAFAVEPFDKFLLEEDLFQTHAELVGKGWDDVVKLNWPLAGTLAAQGELLVVSARDAARRMVGYAVVMMGGDLLSERLVGSVVFLFALPEWPGLGLQLLRGAGELAKVKGAAALWLFQTHDSTYSWRLDILAKRLGGVEVSRTYEVAL